ncbi:CAP domain-containing protein [Streptomyces sp. L2]|uniref:CAP domain-containing protein n=1 Tax=Streptomyces sp. L2 TaxID=2162665 RepID=UPI0013E99231|nr:CAP domain-containing protein [Streptomyces sp. L2]
MTARHKKPKELTPMQKRALKVGAMAPVSAGFVLAAATGSFAADCPLRTQQVTRPTQQEERSTQVDTGSDNVSSQREWHGRQGNWQGDWKLDDQGQWHGQWTPVQDGQTTPDTQATDTSGQREWHGRQGNWQGDWKLDDHGQWHGQWTPVTKEKPSQPDDHRGQPSQPDNHREQPSQPGNHREQPTRHGDERHAAPSNATVRQILQLVNKERAAAGLHPLTLNATLSKAAQAHSDEMARTGLYSHTGPNGSSPGDRIQRAGYRWSMWAENIHHRQGSPEAIMADWMKSPGHRANILNPRLKEIGIGVDANGSYWTQDFGASS